MEAVFLIFPFGEVIILLMIIVPWPEKGPNRTLLFSLLVAWIVGKCLEGLFPTPAPWDWHFSRLITMIVFFVIAWRRSKRRFMPLIVASFSFSIETLFLLNQPGVFLYDTWIATFTLFIICWLIARSFWGSALAFTGSILINQLFIRYTYEGIMKQVDLPASSVWNLGVILFAVWACLGLVWRNLPSKTLDKPGTELLTTDLAEAFNLSDDEL